MIQVMGANVKSSCRLPERGPQRDYLLPIGARAGGLRPERSALEPEPGHGGLPPLIMWGVCRVARRRGVADRSPVDRRRVSEAVGLIFE